MRSATRRASKRRARLSMSLDGIFGALPRGLLAENAPNASMVHGQDFGNSQGVANESGLSASPPDLDPRWPSGPYRRRGSAIWHVDDTSGVRITADHLDESSVRGQPALIAGWTYPTLAATSRTGGGRTRSGNGWRPGRCAHDPAYSQSDDEWPVVRAAFPAIARLLQTGSRRISATTWPPCSSRRRHDAGRLKDRCSAYRSAGGSICGSDPCPGPRLAEG